MHEKIAEAPGMPDCLTSYWLDYVALTGSRAMSEAIPLSEIKSYCEYYGIEDKEYKYFLVKFVNSLCNELASYNEERREREKRMGQLKR